MKKLLLCASAFALMLGSCSKDDTEVAPVEVKGKAAFSASMIIGDGVSSRTHVGDLVNGVYPYYWDKGDAIGASALGTSAVVPFIVDASKFENANDNVASVDFYPQGEDLAYFGEESIYLAYPYDKAVKVSGSQGSEVMNMTIPASQRYRANSFATMTAPAVGIINPEDIVDGQVPDVEMKPVASYVRFGVVGSGKLTSISLTVKNSEGKYFVLNGSADVPLTDGSDYALKLNTSGPTETTAAAAHTNTIDFGKGGIDLAFNDPAYLWFVVPADVKYSNATLTFTATVDNAQSVVEKTYKGSYNAVRNGVLDIPVNIELGMEDKVLIENNADLIEYLYTVSQGTDGDKTAVLVNDLNFSRYDARNDMNGAEGDMLNALTEYLTNGSVIESIAEGAHIDGNDHIISNLQVKGNGIFEGQPASLKNLILSGVTVNVPAEANPALFVGAINLNDCSEGVVIKGGYLKNVAAGATAAMIQNAYYHTLPLPGKVTISYPRVNDSQGEFAYFAAKLTLNESVQVDGDLRAYFSSNYRRFGAIKATSDVKISGVNAAYVSKLLAAISYEGTDKAISVIDTKGTSYWTGIAAASVKNDDVVTAEELAYYVLNGGEVTLTNNIDLQGKDWKAGNGTLTIHGNKKKISNAVVVADETQSQFYTYSLLGNVVTADNLVVEGVEINVEAGSKPCVIGGVAYQGSATNMTVSKVTINVASDVQFYQNKYNHVGGLISHATANSDGNTVSSVAIECNDNENAGPVGAMFGEVSGSFNKNALSESAIAMVGSWTIANTGSVVGCNSNSAIVENVFFTPVSSGVMSLTFDGCSTPCCNNLVNTTSNDIVVDITVGGETKTERLEPGVNKFNK